MTKKTQSEADAGATKTSLRVLVQTDIYPADSVVHEVPENVAKSWIDAGYADASAAAVEAAGGKHFNHE